VLHRFVVSGYWKKLVIIACSIFFRSKAFKYDVLLMTWQHFVVNQSKAVKVADRCVLLGDHTAAIKDGRKMPGVVSMHEASETQSKPSYFRGQCWGAVGLLTGVLSACFCCPLQLQIHQGFTHLGLTEESGKQQQIKLTERIVVMAINFAQTHQCPCYLVLDAFFAAGSVFRAARYYSIELKKPLIEIITKAKKTRLLIFLPQSNQKVDLDDKLSMVKNYDFGSALITPICLRLSPVKCTVKPNRFKS
jgi:hypothetical protein